ncbi:Cell wall-associated hydrolase, NlpC family [Roseateles sp. YR242]|uniref:C40 family peptidase n=1 Tax=Roseateles sp. YR242 TaxID=1855305 RepID=UPI0008B88251|nr:Cell wall-associated hydrolase, NlpC family [Roseateles sp. YR242]
MRTVRPTSSAPHRKKVQRATAALGLLCALTAGSCWAQQSAQASPAAQASKPAAAAQSKSSGKQAAKETAKAPAKVAKSAQAKRDASVKNKSTSKAKGDKADKAESAAAHEDKTDAKLADVKSQDKTADKASDKAEVRTVEARRADNRAPVAKVADTAPPAGIMMGAYGQSLMRTASVNSAAGNSGTPSTMPPSTGTALTAQAGNLAAAAAPVVASVAQNNSAGAPSITAANTVAAPVVPALPATATAMMGAAGPVGGSDSVSRFLQQRGIVAQAQAQTQAENAAIAGNPSLLNEVRDRASNLVLSAMNFLGVPYRRGGNSVSNGFDCSGFTRHIFEMSVGLVLPRRADEQAKMSALVSIKKEDLKPGDLVFFNTMRATFSHVGIYVGEGKFIHSPRAGGAVRVEDMREAYWAKRFTGARRADLTQAPNT